MKARTIFLFCSILFLSELQAQQQNPVDYVNPMTGTLSKHALSTGRYSTWFISIIIRATLENSVLGAGNHG